MAIHFVVYVYVDYRKGLGQRMLKTFASKDCAIAYAKSLTTDFLGVDCADYEPYENREVEYTWLVARVFDAYLAKQGKEEVLKLHPDLKGEFIDRVGVDAAEFIDTISDAVH